MSDFAKLFQVEGIGQILVMQDCSKVARELRHGNYRARSMQRRNKEGKQ